MRTIKDTEELEIPDGVPDEENPEWTRERIANAMTYPNFPPEIMRLIEADKKKKANSSKAA